MHYGMGFAVLLGFLGPSHLSERRRTCMATKKAKKPLKKAKKLEATKPLVRKA
jgi:hypothetical protein